MHQRNYGLLKKFGFKGLQRCLALRPAIVKRFAAPVV
jgi:hypothetical protein